MYCRQCGSELREGASFCAQCGTPIPSTTNAQATAKRDTVASTFGDPTTSSTATKSVSTSRTAPSHGNGKPQSKIIIAILAILAIAAIAAAFLVLDPMGMKEDQPQSDTVAVQTDAAEEERRADEEAERQAAEAEERRAAEEEEKRIAEEAAAAALAAKEAAGRYYTCPYYTIDLPDDIDRRYTIKETESGFDYMGPSDHRMGSGWFASISTGAQYAPVGVAVFTANWGPEGDIRRLELGKASDGNVVWAYISSDGDVSLLNLFANYITVK